MTSPLSMSSDRRFFASNTPMLFMVPAYHSDQNVTTASDSRPHQRGIIRTKYRDRIEGELVIVRKIS
jgi:hypothetical protein